MSVGVLASVVLVPEPGSCSVSGRYTPPSSRRHERRLAVEQARALGCICDPAVRHVGAHHWRVEHDAWCPCRAAGRTVAIVADVDGCAR